MKQFDLSPQSPVMKMQNMFLNHFLFSVVRPIFDRKIPSTVVELPASFEPLRTPLL